VSAAVGGELPDGVAVDDVESSGAVLGFGSSSEAREVAESHVPEKEACAGDDASKAVVATILTEFTGVDFDVGSEVAWEDDNLGGGLCDGSGDVNDEDQKKQCCAVPMILKPFGLVNLGATCYLNAAVGVISSSGVICRFLVDGVDDVQDRGLPFLHALHDVLQFVDCTEGSKVERVGANELFEELGRYDSFFQHKNTHHDVQECLSVLLDCIGSSDENIVRLGFGVDVGTSTLCANGSRGAEKVVSQQMLILEPMAGWSISALFVRNFAEGSVLADECSSCGLKGHCRRMERVDSVPGSSLTIFIKRAGPNNQKSSVAILISEMLRVEESVFALSVVVIHNGTTSLSGHYVYFRRVGVEWFKVDDGQVCGVSLSDVTLNFGVMCNVVLAVYERVDAGFRLIHEPKKCDTIALCLVALCGKFVNARAAFAFLKENNMPGTLRDFANMVPAHVPAPDVEFGLFCGRVLLETALKCSHLDTAKSMARILNKCVPELPIGALEARCALNELLVDDDVPMLRSRNGGKSISKSPAGCLENLPEYVESTPGGQTDSDSSGAGKRRRTGKESGINSSDESDSDDSQQRAPMRKLERLLAGAVSKGSSSESRAVKRCTKRISVAIDEALKVQARYKGVDIAEIAAMVAQKSEILRQLSEEHKLAQLGRVVLEFGVLACAEESRKGLKELVASTSVQTFLVGLCRKGGLKEDELHARGLSFSHATFVNAGTVMAQLSDEDLREQALQRKQLLKNVPKSSGRPRGVFSFSRTNPAPLLPPRASNRIAAVVVAIVANSVVAPAHFVARLGKSACPVDVAVRAALGVDTMVQMRLQVDVDQAYQHYKAATPTRLQYSEAYFLSLLASTELIVKSEMKAGVCNKCFLLDETLEWLSVQARQLLPGADLRDFERLLKEVRVHVFRGQLQHSSSRTSSCASHNPAFVLDERLPAGVSCNESCLACDMVVALAKKLLFACRGSEDLTVQIIAKARLVVFLFGHNVLKSDAERRIRSAHDLVDLCEDGSRAVVYLDMMMKVLPMYPHESKEKWFGKKGWISQVAAIYWRPPLSQGGGFFFYIVLENWQIQKSNAGVILALFDATLKEMRQIAPDICNVVLVCDDGPNYSSNECVLNFPHFAKGLGMAVSEMVVMEGGSGKGPHDAIGGAIQSCVRSQVALGRNATTTAERLACLTGPDGGLRVKNALVALVKLDCSDYDESKSTAGKKSKGGGGKMSIAIKGINDLFHHCWNESIHSFSSRRTALSVASPTVTKLPNGWVGIAASGDVDQDLRVGIASAADLKMPVQRTAKTTDCHNAVRVTFGSDYVKAFVSKLTCPFCFETLAADYEQLLQHFVSHFRWGPFTCICGALFSRKAQSFALHVLVRHLTLAWQCSTCDEFCETASLAEDHCQFRRFSESERQLLCSTCLIAFKTEARFQLHVTRCRERLDDELQKDAVLKQSIQDCLSTMPGMALFGATLRPGVAVNQAKLEELTKQWRALEVEVTLFENGFGRRSVWKELNPSHSKPWVENMLLIILWHLGAQKVNFFRKGDAVTAAAWLDMLGCIGHSARKIAPFFVSITKEQKKEESRKMFAKIADVAISWVRDGLIAGNREIANRVPLALYNSDLFHDHKERFLPYFKANLSMVAFVALFGMVYCTAQKCAVLDANDDETGDLISFGYAEALVALNRLYERGSAGVPLARIELFFGLYESIVGPANILLLSADDVSALQRWLSMADDQDEWRGVLVPTNLSFLSAAECTALKTELQSAVYPYYCTCNTMLGQTNKEQELIACEAAGGCKGRRWFHRECGHEPDEDGNFVCCECGENEM
jgi:hypothetical protein